jgi:uncharacterized membrane protein
LIIEIKAPLIEVGTHFSAQVHQLKHLVPEFLSFLLSFWVIISQWIKHHDLIGSTIAYDKKLVGLNSILLFAIAIIPFSTSYFAKNKGIEFILPTAVYAVQLVPCFFCQFFTF